MSRPASHVDPEKEQRPSGERAPYRVSSGEKGADVEIAHDLPRVGRPAVSRIPFTPPLMRKPKSRATYFPFASEYRHELKGPQSGPLGKMDELMSNRLGENRPEGECDSSSILDGDIFAMRGFGNSPIDFCIGAPGLESVQEIRRPCNDAGGIPLGAGIRRPVTNSGAFATPTCLSGAKRVVP